MTLKPTLAAAVTGPLLALVLASVGAPALAGPRAEKPFAPAGDAAPAKPDLDRCVLRYKDALARIGETSLPAIRAAIADAKEATAAAPPPVSAAAAPANDAAAAALPGHPLFVSPSRKRSPAEIAAMTAAVTLARSRGASTNPTSGTDADRGWVAGRLREELADYLQQKPTPFLCRNVDAYVNGLRKAAERLGVAEDRRPAWIATIRASAERSIEAAGRAIAMSKPALAKAGSLAEAELRHGIGNARAEAPPPAPGATLSNEADLLAAIDGLVAASRNAGLVAEPPVPADTGASVPPTVSAPSRAVLAKLDGLRPLVSSARPLVSDQPVRLKLVSAFADIEMLDYLMKASAPSADPVAGAIAGTLAAIEAAHRAECTCGG